METKLEKILNQVKTRKISLILAANQIENLYINKIKSKEIKKSRRER